MQANAATWRNPSPGNLDLLLDEVRATDVPTAVQAAGLASTDWGRKPPEERLALIVSARDEIAARRQDLQEFIAIETGTPITQAVAELDAVLADFDGVAMDAQRWLGDRDLQGGPHPARVRQRPRGPAAVITPFPFPLQLGNRASLAYLLAGCPVLFKPSPLAATVAGRYAQILSPALPPGVFQVVQGHAPASLDLAVHPAVPVVCFTGSSSAGRHLSQLVAGDLGKDLVLSLGGKNGALICADADLDLAVEAVLEGAMTGAGQRCDNTSRVLVDAAVADAFLERLAANAAGYLPGDPLEPSTRLGPLAHRRAVERHRLLCEHSWDGEWVCRGGVREEHEGLRGHYVLPAILRLEGEPGPEDANVLRQELLCPFLTVRTFTDLDSAVLDINSGELGLGASVFTRDPRLFWSLADRIEVGNIQANLPTTTFQSGLPFGGWKSSGNGRPSGAGFIRFATRQQSAQWRGLDAL